MFIGKTDMIAMIVTRILIAVGTTTTAATIRSPDATSEITATEMIVTMIATIDVIDDSPVFKISFLNCIDYNVYFNVVSKFILLLLYIKLAIHNYCILFALDNSYN